MTAARIIAPTVEATRLAHQLRQDHGGTIALADRGAINIIDAQPIAPALGCFTADYILVECERCSWSDGTQHVTVGITPDRAWIARWTGGPLGPTDDEERAIINHARHATIHHVHPQDVDA